MWAQHLIVSLLGCNFALRKQSKRRQHTNKLTTGRRQQTYEALRFCERASSPPKQNATHNAT
jgi:hypothetical protein